MQRTPPIASPLPAGKPDAPARDHAAGRPAPNVYPFPINRARPVDLYDMREPVFEATHPQPTAMILIGAIGFGLLLVGVIVWFFA